MGFFTGLKKAVVASRIRKAASPINELSKVSCDAYVDLIISYMGITKKVVEEVAYLAYHHADAIADAIITLEPVIKDIKNHEGFKSISKEFESLIETFTSNYEAPLKDKLEVVKEALKAND
jgi:hypothetical protein